MSDDPVTIKFQLTLDDCAKFSADTALSTKDAMNSVESARQCIKILPMLLAFFIVGFAFDFYQNGSSAFCDYFVTAPYRLMFPLFIVLSLFSLWASLYNRGQYSRYQRFVRDRLMLGDNRQVLASSELVLSKDSVFSRSQYSEASTKWSGIEKVLIQNGDFCIFSSSLTAYCIPVRFFSSNEEMKEVYAKCVRWYEIANRPTV